MLRCREAQVGDVCLKDIGILILVHQDVEESFRINGKDIFMIGQQAPPVDEEIVEIHDVEAHFLPTVMIGHGNHGLHLPLQVGIALGNYLLQRLVGIAGEADDVPEDIAAGKSGNLLANCFGQTAIDDLFGVVGIDDDEFIIIPQTLSVDAEDPVRQVVEGAAPEPAHIPGHETGDPAHHGPGSLVGKGRQDYSSRRNSRFQQAGDPIGQRSGLAAAGAGNHQQRSTRFHNYLLLCLV